MDPSDKVKAATTAASGSAAVAAALSTLILWAFQHYTDTAVPEQVALALPIVLGAIFALIGTYVVGYQTRENNPAPSAVTAVQALHPTAAPPSTPPPSYGQPPRPPVGPTR